MVMTSRMFFVLTDWEEVEDCWEVACQIPGCPSLCVHWAVGPSSSTLSYPDPREGPLLPAPRLRMPAEKLCQLQKPQQPLAQAHRGGLEMDLFSFWLN